MSAQARIKNRHSGFFNAAAFDELARAKGLYAESINGDAFSNEIKQQVIDTLKSGMGKVDLVVYSLASPRRTDPFTGEGISKCVKAYGRGLHHQNLNTDTLKITDVTLEPATEAEIAATVKVMGGEDWELWLKALAEADLLADGVKTVAYTYLGEKITWPIYGKATIGKAKEDLDRAALALNGLLSTHKGQANVAVLKALVTQASSAIPIMPLYLSLLMKVMKEEAVTRAVSSSSTVYSLKAFIPPHPVWTARTTLEWMKKSWLSMCRPRLPSCGLW